MVEPLDVERDLPERDWDVAAAYLTPSVAARPDLEAAVMARVRRGDLNRQVVILGFGLAGVAVAVAALAWVRLVAYGPLHAPRLLEIDPRAVLALGLGVFALALGRRALWDA